MDPCQDHSTHRKMAAKAFAKKAAKAAKVSAKALSNGHAEVVEAAADDARGVLTTPSVGELKTSDLVYVPQCHVTVHLA